MGSRLGSGWPRRRHLQSMESHPGVCVSTLCSCCSKGLVEAELCMPTELSGVAKVNLLDP